MAVAITHMPGYGFYIGEHTHVPYNPSPQNHIPKPAFPASKFDDAHKNLTDVYCKLRALQQKWLPLDSMFARRTCDRLRCTSSFATNIRCENDQSHEPYEWESGKIAFDLDRVMDPYEVPLDLSTDGPFEDLPLDVAHALCKREWHARNALKRLPYYYIKNAGDDEAKFQTTAPDSDAQRITAPHAETIQEIDECCRAFLPPLELKLKRFACSPDTAKRIAQNLGPNLTSLQKACIANGGVCEFPGLSGPTMAVSPACLDDVLYAVSSAFCPLLKAEGPTIIKQDQSGTCTVLDYYQYKCAYEDLSTGRPFGCIIELKEPRVNDHVRVF